MAESIERAGVEDETAYRRARTSSVPRPASRRGNSSPVVASASSFNAPLERRQFTMRSPAAPGIDTSVAFPSVDVARSDVGQQRGQLAVAPNSIQPSSSSARSRAGSGDARVAIARRVPFTLRGGRSCHRCAPRMRRTQSPPTYRRSGTASSPWRLNVRGSCAPGSRSVAGSAGSNATRNPLSVDCTRAASCPMRA